MADSVVLGDGDEVEPLGAGGCHQVRKRRGTVRVPGVGVQVAPVPASAPLLLRSPVPLLPCPPALCSLPSALLLQRDHYPIVAPVRSELIEAQYDVPGAGLDESGEIAGGRLVCGDGELLPRRAAPAAESFRAQELGPARVEEANVHNVALLPADLVPAQLAAHLVAHVEPGDARWHLEGQQRKLVCGPIRSVEMAFQYDFCHYNYPVLAGVNSSRRTVTCSRKSRSTSTPMPGPVGMVMVLSGLSANGGTTTSRSK